MPGTFVQRKEDDFDEGSCGINAEHRDLTEEETKPADASRNSMEPTEEAFDSDSQYVRKSARQSQACDMSEFLSKEKLPRFHDIASVYITLFFV